MTDVPQVNKRKPGRPKILPQVMAWFQAEFEKGRNPTLEEVADTLGISKASAQTARSTLRQQGILPPLTGRSQGPRNVNDVFGQEAGREFLTPMARRQHKQQQAVNKILRGGGDVLSPEQRKKLLSEFIKDSSPHVAKGLMETLGRLESEDGSAETYVPPTPITEADAAMRLSRLMRAYGEAVTAAAWCTAFRPEILDATNEPQVPVSVSEQSTESDARVQDGEPAQRQLEGTASEVT
jgi:hypothetical protein